MAESNAGLTVRTVNRNPVVTKDIQVNFYITHIQLIVCIMIASDSSDVLFGRLPG